MDIHKPQEGLPKNDDTHLVSADDVSPLHREIFQESRGARESLRPSSDQTASKFLPDLRIGSSDSWLDVSDLRKPAFAEDKDALGRQILSDTKGNTFYITHDENKEVTEAVVPVGGRTFKFIKNADQTWSEYLGRQEQPLKTQISGFNVSYADDTKTLALLGVPNDQGGASTIFNYPDGSSVSCDSRNGQVLQVNDAHDKCFDLHYDAAGKIDKLIGEFNGIRTKYEKINGYWQSSTAKPTALGEDWIRGPGIYKNMSVEVTTSGTITVWNGPAGNLEHRLDGTEHVTSSAAKLNVRDM